MTESSYNEIKSLSDLEMLRTRTEMFIGSTENPLHLVYELLDNALDEANAGYAKKIFINCGNLLFAISDDGRGIPLKETNGIPGPILACTKLFSGAKFDHNAYKTSIGLHGVGLTAVCALSDRMAILVERDNKRFEAEFVKGKLIESTLVDDLNQKSTGTTISFKPDPEIFKETDLTKNLEEIINRVRLALTAIRTVKVVLNGEEVKAYGDNELISKSVNVGPISIRTSNNDLLVLGYDLSSVQEDINRGAVNLLPVDKGSHINFLRKLIQDIWTPYIANKIIKPQDVLIGCSAYISLFIEDPKYSSQTKESLTSPIRNWDFLVEEFGKGLKKFLDSNEKVRFSLIKKFEDYRDKLNHLSSAAYVDQVIKFGEVNDDTVSRQSAVPKLLDCSSTSREDTELYIVEGQSALKPLRATRNPRLHAILPLKGKILNVIDRDIVSIMSNDEVKSIINGIGAGAYSKFDLTKIRYGKVIIMTDADQDGLNIRALLIGLFNYAMPKLINEGYLYFCEVPLFGYYQGKQFVPCYEETNKSKSAQRYKGLGEMNANELKEVAFSDQRRLIQITSPCDEVTKLVGGSLLKRKLLIDNGVLV